MPPAGRRPAIVSRGTFVQVNLAGQFRRRDRPPLFDILVTGLHVDVNLGGGEVGVAQNPYEMGRIAVEMSYAIISGNEIDSEIDVPIQRITRETLGEM